jgi:hypothetical protein
MAAHEMGGRRHSGSNRVAVMSGPRPAEMFDNSGSGCANKLEAARVAPGHHFPGGRWDKQSEFPNETKAFRSTELHRTIYGEFDPGSGRTLAARLTHASRTLSLPSGGGGVANGCVTREQPASIRGITGGNPG